MSARWPLVVMLALPAQPALADDGRELAAACAGCHRLDGRASGIPPVVGLSEASIVAALTAYRSGARPSQIMHVVAAALHPVEITDVARYLASLKPTEAP